MPDKEVRCGPAQRGVSLRFVPRSGLPQLLRHLCWLRKDLHLWELLGGAQLILRIQNLPRLPGQNLSSLIIMYSRLEITIIHCVARPPPSFFSVMTTLCPSNCRDPSLMSLIGISYLLFQEYAYKSSGLRFLIKTGRQTMTLLYNYYLPLIGKCVLV